MQDVIIKKLEKKEFFRAHFEREVESKLLKAESTKYVFTNVGTGESVPERSDLELVQAACSGNCDSFTELCRRYYPAMVAIAHSVLGDRQLAEDAAQQAFAKAVRKLPQLKKKDKFAGWIATICRNAAKDLLRDRKNLHTGQDFSKIAVESKQNEMTEIVREAIAKLPAPAREVIFLRYYDGLSYEKIGAVLGISEQAINGRLKRAKKKNAGYLRRNGLVEV